MPRALSPYSRGIVERHRQAGKSPKERLDLLKESQRRRGKQETQCVKTKQNLFNQSNENNGEMNTNYQNCGRNSDVSQNYKKSTIKHFKQNPNQALRGYSNNKDLNPKDLSHQTIQNILHDGGLPSFKIPKTMYMTEQQKENRLEFAEKYKKWKSEWKNIIFSEECIIKRGIVGNKFIWSTSRDKIQTSHCQQLEKYLTSVHVWAMIGDEGPKNLQLVTGRLNSQSYTEILNIVFSELGKEKMKAYQFQQDLATCDTSQFTRNWLKTNQIQEFEWIAKGIDLSPIEKCLEMIKEEISKQLYQIQKITQEELFTAIKYAFYYNNKLKRAIKKMYQAILTNIKEIKRKKGDQINA